MTTDYFNGSEDNHKEPLSYSKSDSWIQSTYSDLRNDGTAKYNTDKLMKFSTTQAAHFCREQNISQIGQCDLPNLYQLIILYLESDNIDELDPTVDSNRNTALGMKKSSGRFNFNTGRVWSSTRCSGIYAWHVYFRGYANRDYLLGSRFGVAPVKELV